MRNLHLLLCLLLLPLGAASAADAPPPACQLPMLASLPMTVLPAGKISIPVTISDREFKLIVDTGDVVSGITESAAAQLALTPHSSPQWFKMLGNIDVRDQVRADELKIGNLVAHRFDFLVLPDRAIDANSTGLLGPDIMKNYDIEFDFAHARFNVFESGHCGHNVVYWTKDARAEIPIHLDNQWHITLPVTLDGKPMTATIDSGAERSVMSMSTARALFGIMPDNPALKEASTRILNGSQKVTLYHYHFGVLTLEGVAVNSPDIDILPDSAYDSRNPQLLLGVSILRQLRIYIAYPNQILYATAAEAH